MSNERGCLGRLFWAGCGGAVVVLLLIVVAVFVLRPGGSAAPTNAEERASASSKLENIERSVRTGRPYESRFNEAELTALAREYLAERGIAADVGVELPDDALELAFQTTMEELERLVDAEDLPTLQGAEVRGTIRMHLEIVDDRPVARVESVSLYGLPIPLSLLGSHASENWFDRLEGEDAAVVRRIRSLEVRDRTLFLAFA